MDKTTAGVTLAVSRYMFGFNNVNVIPSISSVQGDCQMKKRFGILMKVCDF